MRKRGSLALDVARQELKKFEKEKKTHSLLIFLTALTLTLFLITVSLEVYKLTGFAGYVESKAGYITEMNILSKRDIYIYGGIYGIAIRIPGFTQMLPQDVGGGAIERADNFFDCIQSNAPGGPEIYASTNPSLSISPATVTPGSPAALDIYLNCSDRPYCAVNTYTGNMTIFIGSTEISNIPSVTTFKNGTSQVFEVGLLDISGSFAYVAKINSTIQAGYNPAYLVNYQLMVGVPENTTSEFWFYVDPNDECPAGSGVGGSIVASIYGYVKDESSNPVANATVNFAGFSNTTDSNGFYNVSGEVLEGTFLVIAQKSGYYPGLNNVTINYTAYIWEKNITLPEIEPAPANETGLIRVYGWVRDVAGTAIQNASIYFGNNTAQTNSSGDYSIYSTAQFGDNPIVAIKTNYDNYYALLNVTSLTTEILHNITMALVNLNEYPTGPYTSGPYTESQTDETPGDTFQIVQEQAEQLGQDYWISPPEIYAIIRENTFKEDKISLYNFRGGTMQVGFIVSPELDGILVLEKDTLSVASQSFDSLTFTMYGTKPIGEYTGKITLTGGVEAEIPVKIEIVPRKFNIESLVMELDIVDNRIAPGDLLKYKLNLQNMLTDQGYKVKLKHLILDTNSSEIFVQEDEEIEILNSLTLLKSLQIPNDLPEGEYTLRIEAEYLGLFSSVNSPVYIYKPLYLYSFFGIPLWIIFVILSALSFITLNVFLYKRYQAKKQRYHLALRLDLLPKPGDRAIKIGKIAERNIPAYYNIDDFTTHGIVAGATGGGKSIAAQVFIEEMLMKNIAVVVFDPTAQWSGMLRKNEDKKMMSFYPKFGLKPSDARAFPGNVRQVTNELESIDINKYINPGQIQIFTMNKLTPIQIDTFVAGVINNIFKSDPKEHPGLKTILVFDEVHRLLPKFGGSGKGFLQIERACREFRKWGLGVMLVSQVLSDFVGEIKANINTEILMRAAEENDLERIKERYGLDALKSLVRADVGTGMIQNAEYNKGLPYFVNLRPILHNTRRLSDEVLEKYNQYNETIFDLEYQIEQLEAEKVDTFDLKMELKLVKDKLMTGNFTVVDIYLEGLKPRLEKEWEKISKKPKKREIKLIDVKELESALLKAKAEREKLAKAQGQEEKKAEVKVDPAAKIVVPITFNNGIMVSSFNELKDVLPGLDDSVFAEHVTEEKNDIAKWVEEQIDKEFAKRIAPIKDKKEMVAALATFGKKEEPKKEGETKKKEKPKESEKNNEDKKDESKKDEKKPEDKKEKPAEPAKPEAEKPTIQEKKSETPKEEKPTTPRSGDGGNITSGAAGQETKKQEEKK